MKIASKVHLFFTTDEHGALKPAVDLQRSIDGCRAESPEGTLLLSGGDVFQGAPESELDHGKPALDLLDKAGYGLVTLGNHDFDYGQKFLTEWTSKAGYTILSANVRDAQGQLLPGVQSSVIKELAGHKIGFIGVTTQTTPELSFKENVAGLQFQDPVPHVRAEVERLKQQGAEVIGLIAHTEVPEEQRIAAEVPGLDFILGGHTHEVYEQARVTSGVPVYRSGSSREAAGHLTLEIEPGSPLKQNWELIRSDTQKSYPGPVQDLADSQLERYRKEMSVPVSYTDRALLVSHSDVGDPIDQLVARGIARSAGTGIGFHNQKTVRANVPEGVVTKGDAARVFPFPNYVQKVEVGSQELLQAVRLSEQRNDHTSLHFYGLEVVRDDQGQAVQLLDLKGKSLPARVEVGTTDFLAGGALNYLEPKEGPKFDHLASVLVQELDEQRWRSFELSSFLEVKLDSVGF